MQHFDAVCPTSSTCRELRGTQSLLRPSAQALAALQGSCIPPDRASIPLASAGTLCHPAGVTADVSIMHEQGSCPHFFPVLNQIKIRCSLGAAARGAATAVWFAASFARRNFSARSGVGAVALESSLPIRHNKARHFHPETTGKSFN